MPSSLLTVTPLAASGISHVFDNIPYGLTAWYDASKISGIASGTSLSAWTDSSGNGNHLSQTSANLQPVLLASGQNGLSVVSFNGSTSIMTAAFTCDLPWTIVSAFAIRTLGGTFQFFTSGKTSGRGDLHIRTDDHFYLGGSSTIGNFTVSANSFGIGIGLADSGSVQTVYYNQTSVVTGGVTPGALGGASLGGRGDNTNKAACVIGEALYYPRVLSTAELSQVTTYLRAKWAAI